ncbi:MAG: nitronate monooxygenase [Halobacteriovoraceae bacterium]|jgi:enoyl-[acyl-carrier protein] reductase II|nr:nitronate monooxygenase [Halobacteriovoraceae bacterium]
MKKTALCKLLNIEFPIIQGGMVWVSGAKLAAASSNAGCLGVIGAGSMNLQLLEQHLLKAKLLTKKPLGINIPIMYKDAKDQIDLALKHGISIFITSAGSPKKFTNYLKEKGAIVIHVTSTPEMAIKCEQVGVDAVIVEGFEAGGHNGRDELTSLVLVPQTVKKVSIPVIAAGGFSCGSSILAALCLGAVGVQMGTLFMMTKESSAHQNYKELLLHTSTTDTMLMMKKHVPVRLVKNEFYTGVQELESNCATKEELINYLDHGKAKKGMFLGQVGSGELEAGQICSNIDKIRSVSEVIQKLVEEYKLCHSQIIN